MRLFLGVLWPLTALGLGACISDAPVTPSDGGGTDGSSSVIDGGADTSTSSDTGGDGTMAWDPSQIPSLALWLDADTAVKNVNGTTDTWKDRSPNHSDAKAMPQAQQPVVLAAAQGINNHQALRFNGTSNFMSVPDGPNVRWDNALVIEIVFRHAVMNMAEGGALISKMTGPNPPNIGLSLYLGTPVAQPYKATLEWMRVSSNFLSYSATNGIDGNAHRLRASWDTSQIVLQVDTDTPIQKAQATMAGLDAQGIDLFIGKVATTSFFVKADIAEIVVLAGANIAPTDVTKLQAYLDTKYAL